MSLIKQYVGKIGLMSLLFFFLLLSNCSQTNPRITGNDGYSIEIDDKRVVISFTENDSIISQQSKGWMAFQYSPNKNKEPRFPGTVAYFRFDWQELEPTEGDYNWQRIDYALDAWKKNGRKFAFRIMTSNAHSKGYYSSPKWLFDKGCKGVEYAYTHNITRPEPDSVLRIEVDYSDSLYLFYHERFIKALASRYDGNENIEFIDIGSYGVWGEWGYTQLPASFEVKKKIFDFYKLNFLKTRLIMMSLSQDLFNYAVTNGIGFRRDGVGILSDAINWEKNNPENKELKLNAWEKVPVVCEWFSNYKTLLSLPYCAIDTGIQFIYKYRATYILDNLGEISDSTVLAKLRKLGQDCGYNLVLKEITHNSSISKGDSNFFTMKWINRGIAPIYRDLNLVVFFSKVYPDSEYCIQKEIILPNVLPDDSANVDISLPANIEKGKYKIGITLVDILAKETIPISIKHPANDGVYYISEIAIK